jgi:hypothetical protein
MASDDLRRQKLHNIEVRLLEIQAELRLIAIETSPTWHPAHEVADMLFPARFRLQEFWRDKVPAPQKATPCESCGGRDIAQCGCFDRCACGHDRRSHTSAGLCTYVGCECYSGLHGPAAILRPAVQTETNP